MIDEPSGASRSERLDALAGEFLARRRRSEDVAIESYAAAHPDLADDIADLFPTLLAMEKAGRGAAIERIGSYRILRELGRGGMGVVYLAHDPRRGEDVALKTLLWGDAAALWRFKQEFRGFADLSHRNLVALHDLVGDGERWFFTMEYVEGDHFLDHVRAHPDRLRRALRQLAEGVAALHAAGKLHRDLKPSNVLVTDDGRVVLLDFGLAADIAATGRHQSTDRHVLGTAAYMAPEQATGRAVSAASDWYSVGAMLFEALAGRLPFEGNPVEVLLEKQRRETGPPSAVAPDVPADLDELCAKLLRRDPAERPDGAEVLRRLAGAAEECASAAPPPPAEPTLIGRGRQTEALADALAATRRGSTTVALVHGASGVGKTVLVERFLADVVRRREAVVFTGRCYEREYVPYKAFDTIVDALSRHLHRLPRADAEGLLPRDVGALTRVFPVLRRVAAIAAAPERGAAGLDPQELRRRAFGALREMLARLSDRTPVVLHVDDAQWGDADSAELLRDLLRAPDPPTLLVVLAYRADDAATSPFLDALRDGAWSAGVERREVALPPLSPDETGALARRLLAEAGDAPDAIASQIAAESRGNPLFVQELVRYLRSGAALGTGGPRVSLDDVLAARLARLPPSARRLLEIVAVAGRPVALAPACEASDIEGVSRQTVTLLRSERLVRGAGAGGDDVIDTYHDRIRETILKSLPPEPLRDRNLRLALALEAAGGTDPEALAALFQGAGDIDRAGRQFARAAADAAQALAFEHAARLFELSLELRPADGDEHRRLVRMLADALANSGRSAEAAPRYLAAAQGAPPHESLLLRRSAAEHYLISGNTAAWFDVVRPLLDAMKIGIPRGTAQTMLSLVAQSLRLKIRGLDFTERREEDVSPDVLLRIDTYWAVSRGLGTIDTIRAAVPMRQALLLVLAAGEPFRVARQFCFVASLMAARREERARASTMIARADAIARRLESPYLNALVLASRVVEACFSGRWRPAWELAPVAQTALQTQSTATAWEVNVARMYGLRAGEYIGDLTGLSSRLAAHLEDDDRRGDLAAATNLRTRFSHLPHLMAGEPAAAASALDAAIAGWSGRGFTVAHLYETVSRMDVALYAGDPEAARRAFAACERPLRRSLLLYVQINEVIVRMCRARTYVALACSDGGVNERRLRRAERDARRMEREKVPYAAAWATLIRACVAAARGESSAAATAFGAADAACLAADMPLFAAAARRRRGELAGGDEGRALVASADAAMSAQGISDPARWAAMYAPGTVGAARLGS